VTTRLTQTRVVIAEGRDEVHLVEAVARQLGLTNLQVLSFEGVDNLRGFLRALPSVSEFTRVRSLGIVCDAEDDARARFQSVTNSLADAGLSAPSDPLVPSPGTPRVVVLINPFGSPAGSLDDVCLETVRSEPAMSCVDAYLTCLEAAGIPLATNRAKTRAHAFIASRDRPDVSLGVALQRGYFPLTHVAFDPVRRLLQPESGVKSARSEFKAFDPVKGMLPGDLPGTAGR